MGKITKRRWTQEDTWECLACKHVNRGRDLTCAKCGSPKNDESDKTAVADEAQAVVDPNLLKQAAAGANVFCQTCRTQLREGTPQCPQCGSTRLGPELPKDNAEFGFVPEASRFDPLKPGYKDVWGGLTDQPGYVPRRTAAPNPWYRRWPVENISPGVLLAILGAAVGVTLLIWALTPTRVTAHVRSVNWAYSAKLFERKLNDGQGWSIPMTVSAFNTRQETRQNGTKDCDPYECNPYQVDCNPYDCRPHSERYQSGSHKCNPHSVRASCGTEEYGCHKSCTSKKNGYSDCSESCSTRTKYCSSTDYDSCPDYSTRTVYDTCYHSCTKYRTCYKQCPNYQPYYWYQYYTWPLIASKETYGVDHAPRWPDLSVSREYQRLDKHESYEIVFTKEDKSWSYHPSSLGEFQRFDIGGTWNLEITMGSVKILEK
jgi:hypothetical protein